MAKGADDAGEDMVVGRMNWSEARTELRAKNGEGGYAADVVFNVVINGGWLFTDGLGIDAIRGEGSIEYDTKAQIGILQPGNGVVGIGQNGVAGYVHGVPRDKGLESKSNAGVLGMGGDQHVGVMGRGQDGVVGISNANDKSGVYGFNSQQSGAAWGVFGRCSSPEGGGVGADSEAGVGVRGHSSGNDGIVGTSGASSRSGVYGFNLLEEGTVYGVFGRCFSSQGAGVSGSNESAGDAVSGFTKHGVAVRGTSEVNDGVVGQTYGPDRSGVYGVNTWAAGRVAMRQEPSAAYGVTGKADDATGIGVYGVSKSGIGVTGFGGKYGATFQGDIAPLRLLPAAIPGAPTRGSHQVGELFVDSNGDLFFCKTSGVPGSWVKVA